MQSKRKLAAILFVDIVGYTAKANQDEREALVVRDEVERLVKSSTLGHHGRVVKTLGDGAMLEFASAVEAVTAAIEIQENMALMNERLAQEEPTLLRIGAHIGDVVEEADDLFGNAVNIASRVLGMAKPGGICITREVHVQIQPILNLRCTPVTVSGEKKFPEPVEVFSIEGSGGGRRSMPAKNKFLIGAAAVLSVLAILYAASVFSGKGLPLRKDDGVAHRLLLPDWVAPGDWFALDAGSDSEHLSVYLGNQPAETRVEGGQVLVLVPSDLPTNKTTISVFRGNEDKPLMSQETQVIVPMRMASNEPGPEGQLVPKAGSGTLSPGETSINGRPQGRPPKTGSSGQGSSARPPNPPGAVPVGVVTHPGVSGEGYEQFVMSLSEEDAKELKLNLEDLPGMADGVKSAVHVVSLAAQGKEQECQVAMRKVKGELSKLPPEVAKEVQSLIKSAEAMSAERGKKGDPEVRRRYADAFAFSMNHGTNNFAGIAMVDRLIRDKNFEEAGRTLGFIRSRGRLSPGELKAIERLEGRLKEAIKSSAPKGDATKSEP